MSSYKPIDASTFSSFKLVIVPSALYFDPTNYKLIVGTLQYLTFMRPDICYVVHKVCQFMHTHTNSH